MSAAPPPGEHASTQVMFVTRALEKISKEAKKHKQVVQACKAALSEIEADQQRDNDGLDLVAYFEPFRLACETGHPKVVDTALDCLQKLVAYGYLGSEVVTDDGRPLVNVVVEVACKCFLSAADAPAVQLQIIKCVLTAVTSTTHAVHGAALLKGVRTVYNIYLVSRSRVNRRTAKVALEQMIDVIFQRMEVNAAPGRSANGAVDAETSGGDAGEPRLTPEALAEHEAAIATGSGTAGPSDNGDGLAAGSGDGASDGDDDGGVAGAADDDASGPAADTGTEIDAGTEVDDTDDGLADGDGPGADGDDAAAAEGGEAEGDQDDGPASGDDGDGDDDGDDGDDGGDGDDVTPAAVALPDLDESRGGSFSLEPPLPPGKYGYCVVCHKPANNYSIQTKHPLCGVECRDAHLAAYDPTADPPARLRHKVVGRGRDEEPTELSDILERDAFLVFRALCKQSVKDIPPNASDESVDMRSKILALELLIKILNESGPVFHDGDKFIAAVKQYLCGTSLLKNGVSPILSVFGLSLSIFQTLLSRFKDHLKDEIGIFFNNIFLRILESANSRIEQKLMVLTVLRDICRQPQTVVNIFVNYDCAMDAMNIFERIVNCLARIAQGSDSNMHHAAASGDKVAEMELLALESAVAILRSMVEWSSDLAEAEATAMRPQGLAGDGDGDEPYDDDAASVVSSAPSSQGAGTGAGSGSVAVDTPTAFEKQKHRKKVYEEGVVKFHAKPKKGIAFLIANGLVEDTPGSICDFLMGNENLNKTAIGNYLGEPGDMSIACMHEWVSRMDFTGVWFVDALRQFLAGFRLPGEAQKIDRIMLKFAERFCFCNPDTFAVADTAYVMAYSTIMLQTDLHSPQIKVKMTLADFINTNRGIDDGNNLPPELLEAIYNDISATKIELDDDLEGLVASGSGGDAKKMRQNYLKETEFMIQKSEMLFKKKLKDSTSSVFYVATHVEHVRLMFEVVWAPIMAMVSILLEVTEDPRVVALCLEGFKCAIRISSIFFLETQRDTFVTSLTKFTYLNNLKEMRPKNVEAIKTLIHVAHTEANFLMDSWRLILRSISQLERLQLLGSGVRADGVTTERVARKDPKKRGSRRRGPHDATDIEQINSQRITAAIDAVAIDRIFTNSVRLTDEAVVEFVKQMCTVANEEISADHPRIFLLQKVVGVATYNMGRIKIVWSRLWEQMSAFFQEAGCHPDRDVADIAVISLRQLSMKFLEKDELSNFSFQKYFLRPFEHVMHRNRDTEVRDMVVACLRQIIVTRTGNIKSGWRVLFNIFATAAADEEKSTISLGFQIVELVLEDAFAHTTEFYVDCIKSLLAYGQQHAFTEISLRAIDYVHFCARELAEGRVTLSVQRDDVLSPGIGASAFPAVTAAASAGAGSGVGDAASDGGSDEGAVIHFTDNPVHTAYWWPLLMGLSNLVGHRTLAVRTKALQVLFDVLKAYGPLFSADLFRLVFRGVLFPIFDDVKHSGDGASSEWLESTCLNALRSLVDLFSVNFERLHATILRDVLALLRSCLLQNNEGLARIGAACLLQLINDNGAAFGEQTWSEIAGTIQQLFAATTPVSLVAFGNETEEPEVSHGDASDEEVAVDGKEIVVEIDSASGSGNDENASDGAAAEDAVVEATDDVDNGPDAVDVSGNDEEASVGEGEAASDAGADDAEASGGSGEGDGSDGEDGEGDAAEPEVELSSADRLAIQVAEEEAAEAAAAAARDPKAEFEGVVVKCVVQLMLIQTVNNVVSTMYASLSEEHLRVFLECLHDSFQFAHDFNSDYELRMSLFKKGYLSMVPNLLRQETNAVACSLRILLRIYVDDSDTLSPAFVKFAEQRLADEMEAVLKAYVALSSDKQTETITWTPIVILILNGYSNFDDDKFSGLLERLFPALSDLILTDRREVRDILRSIHRRVGALTGICPAD